MRGGSVRLGYTSARGDIRAAASSCPHAGKKTGHALWDSVTGLRFGLIFFRSELLAFVVFLPALLVELLHGFALFRLLQLKLAVICIYRFTDFGFVPCRSVIML